MIIIFDFGGVIGRGHIRDMYEHLYRKLDTCGVAAHEFNAAKSKYIDRALKGQISGDELVETVAAEIGMDPADLKAKWQESYDEAIKADPEVLELVKRLKAEHKVVLLTNVIELDAQVNRRRGDYDLFDEVFTSYECKACKPGMEIYMHVLRALHAEPRECIFIDDAQENLIPAAAIGMRTIHFQSAAQLKNELHRIGAL